MLLLTHNASGRADAQPYLDAIIFRAFPNRASAETALRAGTIDLLLTDDTVSFITPGSRDNNLRPQPDPEPPAHSERARMVALTSAINAHGYVE